MQETTNYKLKKPEGTDPVNVADFNENADVIDLELSKRVESAGGDISDTKIGAADTAAQEFPVPVPGDTARGFLGKMRKFCSDFNSFKTGVITLGKLVNNGLTTEEGYALDARYGKTLLDMVTRLNSDLGGLNSNFAGTVLMGGNADIRAYAMSLPTGMHYVTTTAETVNVPNGYNYCAGYILKRSNKSIMIALFNGSSTTQCIYSTDTWIDWKTAIPNSDLGSNFCIANKNLKTDNYGRTICFDGNEKGITSTSDRYYIAIDNSGTLSVGYQSYDKTTITWH